MYKFLIVVTDKSVLNWGSLAAKVSLIKKALNQIKNGTWEVEVQYRDVIPKVDSNFRINHQWYNDFSYPLFRQGYHFVYLHFTETAWTKYKLDQRLLGANQIDTDFVGESYGWSDENTMRKKTRRNQFIQNILHEMSHELARTTRVPDKTHEFHDVNPDITPLFASYDIERWQPTYQAGMKEISRLQAILDSLLKRPQPLVHFVPFHKTLISQGYGVRNEAFYPKVKHHIGVDYATPIGTPILAPCDGTVTHSGYSSQLGNWCGFTTPVGIFYFMHLQAKPVLGIRKQNWVIGFSGNTGLSTGPHLHVELWTERRDVTLLTEYNFRQYTKDVTTLIK